MSELEPWDIRDLDQLMHEVNDRTGLPENTAWLVQVEDPPTEQRIVRIEQFSHGSPAQWWPPGVEPDRWEHRWRPARDEFYEYVESWTVPDVVPPRHLCLIVTVRRGICDFGLAEFDWLNTDRYLNACQPIFKGGVVVVTEHGWADFMSKQGAATPALAC